MTRACPPPYPSVFQPVYTASMKRRRTYASDLPPLLLAAMARTPRARPGKGEGMQKSQNNYIAEASPKARPGAKKGNRNAVTHGLHTVETRARHAAVKAMVGHANALADAVLGKTRHG